MPHELSNDQKSSALAVARPVSRGSEGSSRAVEDFLDRLDGVRPSGDGWIARCPAHEDRHPSLSISTGRDGRVLLHCHAGCSAEAIASAVGLELRDLFECDAGRKIIAVYDYTDYERTLLFQVVRFAPKDFWQWRPDGNGGCIWNLEGTPRVLYRLPEVAAAVDAGTTVYIVEGEKDVEALRDAGAVATCNPIGAGKWRDSYSRVLRGANVVIVQDKDEEGRRHAAAVAESLQGVAASVKIVEAVEGKDAADHVAAGHFVDEFVRVLEPEQATVDQASPTSCDAEEPDISATDVGLAERFVADYVDRFRFISVASNRSTGDGIWLFYNGNRWERQRNAVHLERHIQKMGKTILREALAAKTEAERMRLLKIGNRALSNAGIAAIRARIGVLEGIVASEDDFDNHPHLLSVANGVVNLRTGELLPPDLKLMLSRGSPTAYEPEAAAPAWETFLLEVFDGSPDAATAYESDLGYTLTGEMIEDKAFFDYGPLTRNGKTVIHELIHKRILGPELCVVSTPGTFLLGRFSNEANKPRDDIARWRGARMITTSELPEGARVDEDLFKRLTGRDTISYREGYGREVEFNPTAKLWIRTNNFPALDPDSEATWARVRLHEFPVSFLGREDHGLPARLEAEAEGILARLVRRAVQYYERDGLIPVPEERVHELRYSNDFLGDIIERLFERDPNGFVTAKRFREIEAEEYEQASLKYVPASVSRMERKGFRSRTRRVNSVPTKVFEGLSEGGVDGRGTG